MKAWDRHVSRKILHVKKVKNLQVSSRINGSINQILERAYISKLFA